MNKPKFLTDLQRNSVEQKKMVAMLLESNELPGDHWKVSGESVFRPGHGRRRGGFSQFAGLAGAFTALRFFDQSSPRRWLWIQVYPYATEQDAVDVIPTLPDRMIRNPRLSVIERTMIDNFVIRGVSAPLIFEESTTGPEGPGIGRNIAGNVDHVVFMISSFKFGEAWPWDEVTSVAESQANKVRNVLAQN